MIISKLNAGNFIYYNLHSEEVITSNFLEEINLGIYCTRLQSTTINRIKEDIKKNKSEEIKNIAFDFKYIEAIQPNINKYFNEIKDLGYNIVFTNITKTIIDELGYNSIKNNDNISSELELYNKITLASRKEPGFHRYYFFESANNFFPNKFTPELIFKDYFKKRLIDYSITHKKPHTSSFVYLTSYIDIKKFISYEKNLCMYSIYRLAMKILEEWGKTAPIPPYFPEIKGNRQSPILVCQSLNSSYIVSILSSLLKLDIMILDKIGPINKIYNSVNKNIIQDRNYIVVSDLVCLGTEVKIVKNIIEFFGGKYLGNVALIKTETLKKDHIKKKDATMAIFSINRKNNKELNYHITTNLEDAKG